MQCIVRRVALALIGVMLFMPIFYSLPAILISAYADDNILRIDTNVTWEGDVDLERYAEVHIVSDARVTINPGAHIKMPSVFVFDKAQIVANGTAQKPITFTQTRAEDEWVCTRRPSGTIVFAQSSDGGIILPTSSFTYVIFDGLGSAIDRAECPALVWHRQKPSPSWIATAYAAMPASPLSYTYFDDRSAAIYMRSGRVEMEYCTFINSHDRDIVVALGEERDMHPDTLLRIIRSDFHGSAEHIAVHSRVMRHTLYNHFLTNCLNMCEARYVYSSPWMGRLERGALCREECTPRAEKTEAFFDDTVVQLIQNWYGHESGPDRSYDTWHGTGERVFGNLTIDGWRKNPNIARGSNVLFLPGFKASRLDMDSGDQVWLPEHNVDALRLAMDDSGESREAIHAKDIVQHAYGVADIYGGITDDLRGMKDRGEIVDYALFAYDWRYAVDHIVKHGTRVGDDRVYPLAELRRLAATSHNGKVTIIAHSNGGLLAKAMLATLEQRGDADLVDTVVMVGTPQMGVPKTIGSLFHGYDEKLPQNKHLTLLREADARYIAQNMPGAYGLLPSRTYFARTQDPLITFNATHGVYRDYAMYYGKSLTTFDAFRDFALNREKKRVVPTVDDTTTPAVLREHIFDASVALHDELDAWEPPDGVRLVQIAGWGLDTVRGFRYTSKANEKCEYDFPMTKKTCWADGTFSSFLEPQMTVDGDTTVTTPSALMMDDADHIARYWVDLYKYGRSESMEDHASILQVKPVRKFLASVITHRSSMDPLPSYIFTHRPEDYAQASPRIRMSLYSPLDIHLYDAEGNHTGPIKTEHDGHQITTYEQNIPNSYYIVVGDHKYVGWGGAEDVHVELAGYGEGSYAIHLQEVFVTAHGEKDGDSVAFASLPTRDRTHVTFSVPAKGIAAMSDLMADYDGDGVADYRVAPQINNITTLSEDGVVPDVELPESGPSVRTTRRVSVEKAKITAWQAYQYSTHASCAQKVRVVLTGRHFDKDAVVYIGGTKADKVIHYNSKKIRATFCKDDLMRAKTDSVRTITVINPGAKRSKAEKKIDIANIPIKDEGV